MAKPRYHQKSKSTILAGVMAWPVSHSRSPRLHGYWLQRYGIDGAYLPLAVKPADLAPALAALPKLGFAGCNLTLPHKEAALKLVDRLDPLAKRIGAVNTVIVRANGQLEGRNTDAFGFIAHLRQSAPSWRAASRPCAVIGAGGAARAILVALLDQGAREIRLVNRTHDRALSLVKEFGTHIQALDWAERGRALDGAGLVVNTTSLGMSGHGKLDLPLDPLPRQAIVYDIVYVPLQTRLLAEAKARGLKTVDGLGMLLHQARPGFEAWFGVAPKVDAGLYRHVAADLLER